MSLLLLSQSLESAEGNVDVISLSSVLADGSAIKNSNATLNVEAIIESTFITNRIVDIDVEAIGITNAVGVGEQPNNVNLELLVAIGQLVTNLIENGGFETNTAGWLTNGTNTIERSTDEAKSGIASLKATYSNNIGLVQRTILSLPSNVYTVSAWLKIPSDWDGILIQLRMAGFTGALPSNDVRANANMDVRDEWQRVSLNIEITSDGTGFFQWIITAPTVGRFIYTDDIQLETGTIVHPFVNTDGGIASQFSPVITGLAIRSQDADINAEVDINATGTSIRSNDAEILVQTQVELQSEPNRLGDAVILLESALELTGLKQGVSNGVIDVLNATAATGTLINPSAASIVQLAIVVANGIKTISDDVLLENAADVLGIGSKQFQADIQLELDAIFGSVGNKLIIDDAFIDLLAIVFATTTVTPEEEINLISQLSYVPSSIGPFRNINLISEAVEINV